MAPARLPAYYNAKGAASSSFVGAAAGNVEFNLPTNLTKTEADWIRSSGLS